MKENNFEVGQRVVCVKYNEHTTNERLKGKFGIIKEVAEGLIGVEFDENIKGHSGNWNGKDGHCWWLNEEEVEVIEDEPMRNSLQATKEQQEETSKQAIQFTQEQKEALSRLNEILSKMDLEAITKAIIKMAETFEKVSKVIGEACQKYIEENQIEVDEEFEKAYIEALFKERKDGGENV